jgi:Flp pilus assembly protein CpaB
MRSRGLVVAIAIVLAVLAAVGVIVYTNQVEKSVTEEETTLVVVSSQDIPSNTNLNTLLDTGGFQEIRVPDSALVAGAVTSLEELRDRVTSAPILANEQIPLSRLGEGTLNTVGVSEGHVGLGIQLGGPQSVNGLVQRGDNIVVYATFKKGTPVLKEDLKTLLEPAQVEQLFDAAAGTSTTPLANSDVLFMPFDFTTTLVPSVQVLSIQNPPVDQASGRQGEGSSSLVLDLLPEDAEQITFASTSPSAISMWLGLLPPENEEGYETPATVGVPFTRIVGVGSK